jgi:Ca-activated chloride channel family protein
MLFGSPQILWLLLVLPPALIAFLWWSWRQRNALMTQFIQARLLPDLLSGLSLARQKLRLGALVVAVAFALIALARPQWGYEVEQVKQRGIDIVVAVDTSKSMLAADIAPNRLTRAKLAALELMQIAKADRLGLVAFAGTAFLQCPLTIDDAAFRQSVEALDVNLIPQGGTAIAEAIQTALTAFKEGNNHKVLVLMTDGEDHDSGAVEAAKKGAELGLKIYTIGIGTAEGELLKINDAQGHSDYVRDENGNVVKSHLNEELLREIAGATEGGFYLPLRGAKTIDSLYELGLAKLPKSEHQEKLIKQYHERYQWPLSVAIVLLVFEMLLPERKHEPKTKPETQATIKPKLTAAAALVLLLLLPLCAWGSSSSALREYKTGKYDQALKDYQKLLEANQDDPRLHFNAGASAYRSEKFDEAAKQFEKALASPDLSLQQSAYYNRGNTWYWLGEKNPDLKQKNEAWQKSLKDFDASMKLNPQDADAKYNHEFVKRRLEELKQQQQNQSQQNKSDQQNQDQDQQQQQQHQNQNDQSKQDQNQQQQAQQNQSEQKQDSGQQNQQQQQQQQQQAENQSQQQQAQPPQPSPDKQQTNQTAAAQQKQDSEEKDRESGNTYAAGQMTPEQARELLDSEKGEEMMLPVKPEGKPFDRNKPFRDW